MLYKNFIEKFDILNNNYIYYIILLFLFIHSLTFKINNKNKYYSIILKFKKQQILR